MRPAISFILASTLVLSGIFFAAQSFTAFADTPPVGYSLIDVERTHGSCPDGPKYFYGAFVDGRCTNTRRVFGPNQWVTAYELKIQAKKGDILRINGVINLTNDGDQEQLLDEEARRCAVIMNMPIPVISDTPGVFSDFDYMKWRLNVLDLCDGKTIPATATTSEIVYPDVREAWMKAPLTSMVSPSGTKEVKTPTLAIVELVANGQLVGSRARQKHTIVWDNGRTCLNVGTNCRGHMSTELSGLYVAPQDGEIDFTIQAVENTGIPQKTFFADGTGDMIIEQYRKPTIPTDGRGLAEVMTTKAQLVSSYPAGGCVGAGANIVQSNPSPYTVYTFNLPANSGDIIRLFANGIGKSSTRLDVDATALDIWSQVNGGSLQRVLKTVRPGASSAFSVYGTSVYYPYAMVQTEAFETITDATAGQKTYYATMHGSDTPQTQFVDADGNCDPTKVVADSANAYGGLVEPGTGSFSLMRYSPLGSAADLKLLQLSKEYKAANLQRVGVNNNNTWQTVFKDTFTMPKVGSVRVDSQLELINNNLADAAGMTTCDARVIVTPGEVGGITRNNVYYGTDYLYLRPTTIQNLTAGQHTFETQVKCTTPDGKARVYGLLTPESQYASLEVFY